MTEKTNDEWIEWTPTDTSTNPAGDSYVDYELRGGHKGDKELASQLIWRTFRLHNGNEIVKYRLSRFSRDEAEAPEQEPAAEPATFTVTGPGEYVTRDGKKAVVQVVGLRGYYPACGYLCREEIDTAEQWTLEGRFFRSSESSNLDIVGRWKPYKDIAIDTLVWVRDEGDSTWRPRHFAGVGEDGEPRVWVSGCSSHTAEGKTTRWDELSLTKP